MTERRWPPNVNGTAVPYGLPVAELRVLALRASSERWAALPALARAGTSDALGALADLSASPDPYVRRAAVEAIGMHADGRSVRDRVAELLLDQDERVVRTAADAASALGLHEVRDLVMPLLARKDPATRAVAVRTVARLWYEDVFPVLLDIQKRDPVDFVRKDAARVLRECATAVRSRDLFGMWHADAFARHRLWACEVAEMYPNKEYATALERLITDIDGHVRKAAQRALQAIESAVQQPAAPDGAPSSARHGAPRVSG